MRHIHPCQLINLLEEELLVVTDVHDKWFLIFVFA